MQMNCLRKRMKQRKCSHVVRSYDCSSASYVVSAVMLKEVMCKQTLRADIRADYQS